MQESHALAFARRLWKGCGMDALPPGTEFVDAFVIDLNGIARGKRIPAADWPQAASGVGFSASCLVLDARGNAQGPCGVGTLDGDPDAMGLPVEGMLVPVPWSPYKVAQCLLSMRNASGEALWFDPRQILQGVVDRCRSDGLHPVVACELEFYLVSINGDGRIVPPGDRDGRAACNAGHLMLQTIEEHGAVLHALHHSLALQGIEAGVVVSEYGAGQFEVNLRHTPDPVLACDQAVMLRRAAVGVAAAQGQRATFMAKPYARQPGSGLHVHMSLLDDAGAAIFAEGGGQAALEHAVGGMQRLHAQSMALFAPNFSAYRRYRGGAFVADESSWGEDDRSVAFRIPRGPRRIEHRVAGADASPHLAMAAILAAAHHGIIRKLAPTPAKSANSSPRKAKALPDDIFSALRALEQPGALHEYLPQEFPALFAALKRGEARDLLEEVQPIEHEFYL